MGPRGPGPLVLPVSGSQVEIPLPKYSAQRPETVGLFPAAEHSGSAQQAETAGLLPPQSTSP